MATQGRFKNGGTADFTTPSKVRLFADRIYLPAATSGRLLPLEGLRGIAVVLVFCVHFHALFGPYAVTAPVLWLPSDFMGLVGNCGVDLFFALSGYLIYSGLIRKKPRPGRFLVRRVQRIYPTFLVVFAMYIGLSLLFPSAGRLSGRTPAGLAMYIAENLLLLPGVFRIEPIITVAWSLSYEFCFYIGLVVAIWASKMWLWRPRLRVLVMVSVWVCYFALTFTMQQSHVRALLFIVGMLVFEAVENVAFLRSLTRRREFAAIGFFVATLFFAYFLDRHPSLLTALPGWRAGRANAPGILAYQGPYKTLAFSLSMFWLTAYICAFPGKLQTLCSWLPLRYLGNMSYSYYLIHGVTLQGAALVLRAVCPPDAQWALPVFVAAIPGAFLLTWMTSTALFVFIETPFSIAGSAAKTAPPETSDCGSRVAVEGA